METLEKQNKFKVIAIIPARGGSKGIPKKNIRFFAGKPLIAWTILLAKSIKIIDEVYVSTDCLEIAAVSENFGAKVLHRPPHLAGDHSLVIDTLKHHLVELSSHYKIENLVVTLLEPTAPLRIALDISNCLNLLFENDFDSTATFQEASINPHRLWKIQSNKPEVFISGAIPWLPRQKLPEAFELNGYVYCFKANKLKDDSPSLLVGNFGASITPQERSIGDIDTLLQFEFQEYYFKKLMNLS